MHKIGDHPYITSAKRVGGWVQKIAVVAEVQYCNADIVGGGSEKVQKYADVINGWSLIMVCGLLTYEACSGSKSKSGSVIHCCLIVCEDLHRPPTAALDDDRPQ